MRLKKDILQELDAVNVDIVSNTYVLLEGEEFIHSSTLALQLFLTYRVDYIRFRTHLIYLADTFWAEMNVEERNICFKNNVKPLLLSWEASGFTTPELNKFFEIVTGHQKKARVQRLNILDACLSWRFTETENLNFKIDCRNMIYDYILFNSPEWSIFLDSVDSTVLGVTYSYSLNGFDTKSYYTLDHQKIINDILFND